jgi:hypothetical protein
MSQQEWKKTTTSSYQQREFYFCFIYFIFCCGGNFLDDPFIPHRQPAETSLFHSFLSDCVPLFAQIGFCAVTRINLVLILYTYDVKQHSSFPYFSMSFHCPFSLFIIFYYFFYLRSVLISGNLRIDRSSIDHDHRDNSGVVVGFSFVVQLKRIMRTKDTFTQTRIKELRRKLLTDNIFFDWFFSVYYPPFFSLVVVVVSFYNCSCLSSLSYCYDYDGAIWFSFTESFLTVWLFTHAAKTSSIYVDVDSLSLWNPPPLLVVSTCCTVVVQQKSWPEWPTTKFIWLYTHCVVLLLPYLLSCCS